MMLKREKQIEFLQEFDGRMKEREEKFSSNKECRDVLNRFDYLLDEDDAERAYG